MHEGCLNLSFFFVTLRSPKPCRILPAFGNIGKLSLSRDASNWFHNVLTYNEKIIKI